MDRKNTAHCESETSTTITNMSKYLTIVKEYEVEPRNDERCPRDIAGTISVDTFLRWKFNPQEIIRYQVFVAHFAIDSTPQFTI